MRYAADAIKFASIGASGVIVAAVADKKVRVLAVFGNVEHASVGAVRFLDSAFNNLTGLMRANDGTGFVMAFNEDGWLETAVGKGLQYSVSAGSSFRGALVYVLV